jgi:hypothetical protein
MINSLARLPGAMLLVAILFTSAISTSFLFNRLQEDSTASLVPAARSPDELVETLKKLSPSERSTKVAAQVESLISEPLNIDIINNVALLEALGDNPKKSESIVVEAASRSLRDVQSQLSAVNILLGKREFGKAMFHIDGLLRSRPKLEEQLFRVLSQVRREPRGLTNVAEVLNQNPIWRWHYLDTVFTEDEKGLEAFQLLTTLRKAGGRVTDDELHYYIGAQIGKKNYDIAYFAWLDSLDEEALKMVSFVYDGKFDRTPRNQYFDWTIHPYANSIIDVITNPGEPSNRVLSMDFRGSRDAFAHVQQYLKLPPGDYQLTGEWQAEKFQSPSGFQWQVYCLGGAENSPPSRPLGTTNAWEKFSFSVTVPLEKCDTQLLQLQSASVAVLDQRFDGAVLIDNLNLTLKSDFPKGKEEGGNVQ